MSIIFYILFYIYIVLAQENYLQYLHYIQMLT
jgi:hypothetical protein